MNYEYVDSHIEWIGQYPKHWKIYRFKDFLYFLNGNGFPNKYQGRNKDEAEIPFLKVSDINKQEVFVNSAQNYVLKDEIKDNSWTLIPKYSLLLAKIGEALRKNHRAINESDCLIDNNMLSMTPKEKISIKYLYYLMLNTDMDFFLKPGAVPAIGMRWLKHHKCSIPKIKEQQYITNYLDKACEKIENTINIKERQINEINEYYNSLIHEAITQGLNKNVELENSDIEWIGKYPKHWDIKRLFNICSFIRGSSTFGKNDLLEQGKYVALQYGKTYKVEEVNEQFQFYVNDEFYKSSQVVNYGDTIFVSTSETMEDLGHSVFYNREDIGLIGGEQILLKPNKNILDEKYLFYSSKVFGKGLKKFATGIKVFRFDVYDLKTIYTPIPPIKEQIEISNYLETTSLKISSMKKNIESQIQTLKDYRKSLIYECVTGKKQIYKGEI